MKNNKNGTQTPVDFYNCASYTLTLQRETKKCCSHSITTKAIRAIILETIQTVSTYAISNEAEFMEKVLEASRLKQESEAKGLKRKISRAKKRSAELESALQQYRGLEAQAIEFKPHMKRSTVPLPWQKPEGTFPICWMNMRKNPALSGSGFAIISRSKLHFAKKKKTGVGKHMGITKYKGLSIFS